jgi:hypothetical protein
MQNVITAKNKPLVIRDSIGRDFKFEINLVIKPGEYNFFQNDEASDTSFFLVNKNTTIKDCKWIHNGYIISPSDAFVLDFNDSPVKRPKYLYTAKIFSAKENKISDDIMDAMHEMCKYFDINKEMKYITGFEIDTSKSEIEVHDDYIFIYNDTLNKSRINIFSSLDEDNNVVAVMITNKEKA